MDEVTELMVEQLRDLHSAEKQLVRALPKMMKAATSPALKACIEAHLAETKTHVTRLEQALAALDSRPGRKVCAAMKGILEEGSEELEDNEPGPMLDVLIIASGQRVEHYEIAGYGTACTLAKSAGFAEVKDLLGQTLGEEKAADEKLTEVAEGEVNPAFLSHARGEAPPEPANANPKTKSRKAS